MSLYFYNAKIIDDDGDSRLIIDGIVEFDIDGTYENELELKAKILKSKGFNMDGIKNMVEAGWGISLTKLNKV